MSSEHKMTFPKVSNVDILRIFWTHVRRYPGYFTLLVIGVIGAETGSAVAQWFVRQFVDTISSGTKDVHALLIVLAMVVGFHLFGWTCWRVAGYTAGWTMPKVMADLEETSFSYLLGHSYQFFADSFAGSLVRRVTRLSRAYADVGDVLQWRILPLIVFTSWTLFFVWRLNHLVAAFLAVYIFVFVGMNFFTVRIRHRLRVQRAAKDSEVTGAIADTLTNMVNVKLFTGFTREMKRFGVLNEERRVLHTRSWWVGETNFLFQNILMLLIEIVVMYTTVRLWDEGKLSVGDVVLFQTYLLMLFNKMFDFGKVLRTLYEAFADAEEMVEILALPHGVVDRRGAKALRVKKGEIVFERANFHYQNGKTVLKDLSLTIKPGEKVALVGPSGAGKSTIVKVLFRFYDLTGGNILIDGQKISQVTQDSLRSEIALVPQEPVLFHRTLKDNIRYGRPDATDEEVIEAAKRAHCHDFILTLDEGYETYVGERGVKLSGGERQRVAIARAILKNAPILVLDEATSSLDSESEALIQDALKTLMRDKTVIVIAHRLSTIMQMDRIVVLEQGSVVDTGTHDELVKTNGGLYQKLWQLQAGGFLVE